MAIPSEQEFTVAEIPVVLKCIDDPQHGKVVTLFFPDAEKEAHYLYDKAATVAYKIENAAQANIQTREFFVPGVPAATGEHPYETGWRYKFRDCKTMKEEEVEALFKAFAKACYQMAEKYPTYAAVEREDRLKSAQSSEWQERERAKLAENALLPFTAMVVEWLNAHKIAVTPDQWADYRTRVGQFFDSKAVSTDMRGLLIEEAKDRRGR